MAVSGIKGAPGTYYVIKGSVSPTDVAGYWSSLVTQQKKQLFDNALSIALQEAKTAENRYEAEMAAYQKVAKQYADAKMKVSKQMNDLQVKELQSAQQLELKAAPSVSTREVYTTDTGTSGGRAGGRPPANETYEGLKKRRSDLSVRRADLATKATALTGTPLYADYQKSVAEIDQEIQRIDTKTQQMERAGTTTTPVDGGTAGTTSGKKVRELETTRKTDVSGIEPLDLQEQIDALQKELEGINAAEAAMRAPTAPTGDVLGRTREIAGYGSRTLEPMRGDLSKYQDLERRMMEKYSPTTVPKERPTLPVSSQVMPDYLKEEPFPMKGEARRLPALQPGMPLDIEEPGSRFDVMGQGDVRQIPGVPEFSPIPPRPPVSQIAQPLVSQPPDKARFPGPRLDIIREEPFPGPRLDVITTPPGQAEMTEPQKGLKIPSKKQIKKKETEDLITAIEAGTNVMKDEARAIQATEDAPSSYQAIVKQLYSTAHGKPAYDRVRVRDNAYQELQKTYAGDKETLGKAVELLITLDALEMGALADNPIGE